MGIINKIPDTSKPIWTANVFNAAFNVPTINRYDFSATACNVNQIAYPLLNKAAYVIESINFSADIPEAAYQQSIDRTVSLPRVIISKRRDNQQIYLRPLSFLKFYEGLEINAWFITNQVPDDLLITFQGVFIQPAAIAGLASLDMYIQFVMYEIQDIDYLKQYQHGRA